MPVISRARRNSCREIPFPPAMRPICLVLGRWLNSIDSGLASDHHGETEKLTGLLVAISTPGMPTFRAEHNRPTDTSTARASNGKIAVGMRIAALKTYRL
jgi:hypothetical protein